MAKMVNFRILGLLILIILAWVLAACGPAPLASASSTGDLREIEVADVRVEIGVGSPIPVEVLVSGSWPGLCAQIAEIKQEAGEYQFEISLLATHDLPGCPPDHLGLPFGMRIPLNMVEQPTGEYTVMVNGASTTFEWNPGQ